MALARQILILPERSRSFANPIGNCPATQLCGILRLGNVCGGPLGNIPLSPLPAHSLPHEFMVQISLREWQIVSVAAIVAAAAGTALWWFSRKKPSADELELERREALLSFGRIVDGMLLDSFEIIAEDEPGIESGSARQMLLYQYEISGVSYECSQDITTLSEVLNPAEVKVGMPCSIRYQPGSPENSILVSERWSGLRDGVPVMWLSPNDPRP
jgi:hypothetical protein